MTGLWPTRGASPSCRSVERKRRVPTDHGVDRVYRDASANRPTGLAQFGARGPGRTDVLTSACRYCGGQGGRQGCIGRVSVGDGQPAIEPTFMRIVFSRRIGARDFVGPMPAWETDAGGPDAVGVRGVHCVSGRKGCLGATGEMLQVRAPLASATQRSGSQTQVVVGVVAGDVEFRHAERWTKTLSGWRPRPRGRHVRARVAWSWTRDRSAEASACQDWDARRW